MPAKKSTKRRARGTGALFFSEKRQVWIGRVQVGRLASGAPLYAERSARTQAACLKKLAAAGPPGYDKKRVCSSLHHSAILEDLSRPARTSLHSQALCKVVIEWDQ